MNLAASTSAVPPVLAEPRFQAFERQGLFSRAAPFLGAMLLAIVVYPLPPVGHSSSALFTAAALNALILVSAALAPWRLLPHFAQVVDDGFEDAGRQPAPCLLVDRFPGRQIVGHQPHCRPPRTM